MFLQVKCYAALMCVWEFFGYGGYTEFFCKGVFGVGIVVVEFTPFYSFQFTELFETEVQGNVFLHFAVRGKYGDFFFLFIVNAGGGYCFLFTMVVGHGAWHAGDSFQGDSLSIGRGIAEGIKGGLADGFSEGVGGDHAAFIYEKGLACNFYPVGMV